MNRVRYLLAVIASLVLSPLCSWGGLPGSSAEAPRPHLPGEIAMKRVSRSEGAIMVELRLGDGEEVWLKVDTGAPDTTLDESLAPKLGPRIGTSTLLLSSTRRREPRGFIERQNSTRATPNY